MSSSISSNGVCLQPLTRWVKPMTFSSKKARGRNTLRACTTPSRSGYLGCDATPPGTCRLVEQVVYG
eukprot:10123287-Lingulodinium_polyedra.AAC.1